MTLYDADALKFLASEVGKDDAAASSHWRYYSRDFSLAYDGTAVGFHGFGESRRYYSPLAQHFHSFMQRRWRKPAKSYKSFAFFDNKMDVICRVKNKAYSLDALRQTLTLAALDEKDELGRDHVVVVIGDGFANMSSLLLESGVARKVILVNLNTTLYVDLCNLMGLPKINFGSIQLITNKKEAIQADADDKIKIIALQAEKHELLRHLKFDLAFNIASMQEMDLPVIQSYFEHLRAVAKNNPVQFYCCNRISKILPDGSKVRFADYGWRDGDVHIIDEECWWHRHYYRRFLPIYFKFDGIIWHRFTTLTAD